MEAGAWRGIFTLFMFLAFVGIFLWAYSSRRKQEFDEAASLPLEEDELINAGINAESKIPQGAPKQ